MILRPRPHWLRMLFVWRGSVLRSILPQLGLVALWAGLVTVAHGQLAGWKVTLTVVPFSLIGVSLAIFLGFRINASYDRWWEGRKLWGAVLAETRSASRLAIAHAAPAAAVPAFVHALAAVGHALRLQLRDGQVDREGDIGRRLPALWPQALPPVDAVAVAARPMLLMRWLSGWVAERRRDGCLDAPIVLALETQLSALSAAIAGCERIGSTPLPFTYSVIIHRTVYLYSLLLPFGLVDAIGGMTPLISAFVAYAFFALEALSDEIEQPFGLQANDLPLEAISLGIERSLREMLGEPAESLPPLPAPGPDWLLR